MNDLSKQYHAGFQYQDGLEVGSAVVHTCGPHVYVASFSSGCLVLSCFYLLL